MTAYEAALQEMVRRIDELESAASIAKTSLISDNTSLRVLRERIEALEDADKDRGERQLYWEKHLSVELRNTNDLINESKLLPLFSHREKLGELKTRVGALETRLEATLSTLKGNGIRGDNPLYADRAHGPLEAKVMPSAPGWSQWNDNVDALVKAVQEALAVATRYRGMPLGPDEIEALQRTVKPFEAVMR